jgi:NAD+ kinase
MAGWKRVGIAVKDPAQTGDLLGRIVALLRDARLDVVIEQPPAGAPAAIPGVLTASRERLVGEADLLVVLGGDGTVLAVARALGERATPIVAVNLGHLGFLTDIAPEEAEAVLSAALRGEYELLVRSRLAVRHARAGAAPPVAVQVLNDAVFTKGAPLARMIELEVRVEGALVTTYRSDGLIVATPTGSTAYNLSAGGPLVAPDLPAIVLAPICPHTLSQRPLVLPDHVRIEVSLRSGEDATLTFDGQASEPLGPRDVVELTRSPHPVRFVTPQHHSYFETLREKLRWGTP